MRFSPVLTLPVLAAGALAVAGCGSASKDSNATTSPPAPATTTNAATAPTSPSDTPAKGPVPVTLSEWKVASSAAPVKAGKVAFDVTNDGNTMHEFVVLRTPKKAADLGPKDAGRVSEKGHVGEVGDLAPGKSAKVTLKLEPGHYSLVCNMAGHWSAGMHTDLTVT
jgi:uncharacterized cupredoxin-like copper-binding protein